MATVSPFAALTAIEEEVGNSMEITDNPKLPQNKGMDKVNRSRVPESQLEKNTTLVEELPVRVNMNITEERRTYRPQTTQIPILAKSTNFRALVERNLVAYVSTRHGKNKALDQVQFLYNH